MPLAPVRCINRRLQTVEEPVEIPVPKALHLVIVKCIAEDQRTWKYRTFVTDDLDSHLDSHDEDWEVQQVITYAHSEATLFPVFSFQDFTKRNHLVAWER